MKSDYIKSNYSFSYSTKGIFIIDNNTQKKSKVSFSRFNKSTTIKGKILNTKFVIKSVVETKIKLRSHPHIQRNDTYERIVYLNDQKIGKLTRDFELIQGLNAIAGIPTIIRIGEYRIIYFHPYIRKIELFKGAELLGYTKKKKDTYDLYTKNEETIPLLLSLCLATFDSSIL